MTLEGAAIWLAQATAVDKMRQLPCCDCPLLFRNCLPFIGTLLVVLLAAIAMRTSAHRWFRWVGEVFLVLTVIGYLMTTLFVARLGIWWPAPLGNPVPAGAEEPVVWSPAANIVFLVAWYSVTALGWIGTRHLCARKERQPGREDSAAFVLARLSRAGPE